VCDSVRVSLTAMIRNNDHL